MRSTIAVGKLEKTLSCYNFYFSWMLIACFPVSLGIKKKCVSKVVSNLEAGGTFLIPTEKQVIHARKSKTFSHSKFRKLWQQNTISCQVRTYKSIQIWMSTQKESSVLKFVLIFTCWEWHYEKREFSTWLFFNCIKSAQDFRSW